MKKIAIFVLCLGLGICSQAQTFEKGDRPGTIRTNSFLNDWFVQLGLDMSLQNPYGYNFAHVFPNGKTFGVDVAVGKWFTHQVGVRGKLNWENGIPLFENRHANWVAPFYHPGVNMDKGGYLAMYGDLLVNLHGLFAEYKPERTWHLSVYPRIGVNYNLGVSKGAILAGLGFLNTYRLNERWSLYADLAYIMTGSGFVGENESGGTGTGSNSNGYFSVGVGVQMTLGNRGAGAKTVNTNHFWDNWFLQAGLDMSLMNPYGTNFSEVFPKGKTFGVNVAMGKWFTPEFAVRGRLYWENGLIENKHLKWVPPTSHPEKNFSGGGFGAASLDALFNVTDIMAGYDPDRKWHTSAFVRAGVISHFEEGTGSPLGGVGLEQTYRLNDRLSLFADAAYQVTTSESSGGRGTGMKVAAGSNGFFDIDLGVVYDLGENKFYKTYPHPRQSLGGEGHNWSRFIVNTTASVGVAFGVKTALKKVVKEERPDHSDNHSFPSGHAAMAFAAATSLHKEFGKECPWVSVAGFGAATAIGIERVLSDRHHWYDVVAGAGIGMAATELTWWVSSRVTKQEKVAVGVTGNSVDVAIKL